MWSPAVFLFLTAALGSGPAANRPTSKARQNVGFESVLRLQVLLDRAHFSPGEVDGKSGSNLKAAVEAYKRHRMQGAPAGDHAVAERLTATDPAPTLISYTITDADVAGPFAPIPADLMEQANLKALGYESALEGLGEQFHASEALLQRLNPGKKFTAGEEIQVPNVQRLKIGKAMKVVVSMSDQSVIALDAQDVVLARYPATLGSERDPLPVGNWKINGVRRDPTFAYNPALFWDAKPDQAKATLPAGPNSPVGVVWIDLSKESMGIHGTPTPSVIGKRQSHGCIRLTNWDARELSGLVAPGVPALLTE